jgi:hypothetical protein
MIMADVLIPETDDLAALRAEVAQLRASSAAVAARCEALEAALDTLRHAIERDFAADEDNEWQCRDRRDAVWAAIRAARALRSTP